MKVRLTRESVCAGDDVDGPHEKCITVPDGTTVGDLAKIIQKEYLPRISCGAATWSLVTEIPVGVLAQQWPEPKLLARFELGLAKLNQQDGTVKAHVNYHAQLDPEIVFEVLSRLKLETTQQ